MIFFVSVFDYFLFHFCLVYLTHCFFYSESVPDMVSVASLASSTPVPPTPPQPSNKRPASSTTASKKVKKEVPPVPTPSPPKPIPPPPSKPARKKTDLAERMKKDVKTLEKLDMRTAFKGMINSANKLMPFHLLDESEENPDIAERVLSLMALKYRN